MESMKKEISLNSINMFIGSSMAIESLGKVLPFSFGAKLLYLYIQDNDKAGLLEYIQEINNDLKEEESESRLVVSFCDNAIEITWSWRYKQKLYLRIYDKVVLFYSENCDDTWLAYGYTFANRKGAKTKQERYLIYDITDGSDAPKREEDISKIHNAKFNSMEELIAFMDGLGYKTMERFGHYYCPDSTWELCYREFAYGTPHYRVEYYPFDKSMGRSTPKKSIGEEVADNFIIFIEVWEDVIIL